MKAFRFFLLGIIAVASVSNLSQAYAGEHTNGKTRLTFSMKQNNVITGDGQTKTISVSDDEATLKGDNNTITVKGVTTTLRVIGRGNVVICEGLKAVVIAGDENKVTYKTSPNANGKPTVRSVGKNNSVQQ